MGLRKSLYLLSCAVIFLSGCASTGPLPFSYKHPNAGPSVKPGQVLDSIQLDVETENQILALDPENISADDVKNVLSKAPAPRILNIHGGIYPVHLCMISFSEFLIGMGYPEKSIRNPIDGSFSYSCYFDSRKIAGLLAWYYEREGLRPMMIGHSQGGMQAVKVLYELRGMFAKEIPVYNPLTKKIEDRTTIIDPLTGEELPIVKGVSSSFVTAVGAGGLTRMLPNQWSVNGTLRLIPDNTEEFTGFFMGMDILGGDLLGLNGGINTYRAVGKTQVRNVHLPLGYEHVTVPNTKHLILEPETRAWIDRYKPVENPQVPTLKGNVSNILWAADVWHSIKKHWCLELQRIIRQKRALAQKSASKP